MIEEDITKYLAWLKHQAVKCRLCNQEDFEREIAIYQKIKNVFFSLDRLKKSMEAENE